MSSAGACLAEAAVVFVITDLCWHSGDMHLYAFPVSV